MPFDFKAAFPSISHEFLLQSLDHLGLPEGAINVIRALYDQVKCSLRFKGSTHDSFMVRSGIRQGCPLSPLLFAATVDIILRRLHRLSPDAFLRAFADDIGAVFADLPRGAELLMQESISGLALDLDKTVGVPL